MFQTTWGNCKFNHALRIFDVQKRVNQSSNETVATADTVNDMRRVLLWKIRLSTNACIIAKTCYNYFI